VGDSAAMPTPPKTLRFALALGAGLLLACATGTRAADTPPAAAPPAGDPGPTAALNLDSPEARILLAALESDRAYERLGWLSDYVGPRLSGSENLERAIAWAKDLLEADGLENVHLQEVMVPHWVRGEESAEIVAPASRRLHILGLGGSVGTPEDGIEAEVVAVDSFEALDALGEAVAGKIVLVNVPMQDDIDPFDAYDAVFQYRSRAAARAAPHGAVAVLVRSLTTRSLRTPHTGGLSYADGVPKIPAASVAIEDAMRIQRFLDRGETVRVRLVMGAKTLPDAPSANVIAEWRGRERPDEIVLVGAHIDAWDVGDGAHDDGAGVVVAMEAAAILQRLDLRPRRTIRVVLFTNEENGLRGALAYAEAYDPDAHVAAIEMDSGADRPLGFDVEGGDEVVEAVRALAEPLEALGADRIRAGFSGVDLIPLVRVGVPGLGLMPDPQRYFDLHHTAADTFDKIDPKSLREQVAAVTIMAWRLAEAETPLPRGVVAED
jgi:carboxypeptidase Q